MFSDYANEYRDWAEKCSALAGDAWHVEAKTAWLQLAHKWQRLAELADKYAAQQARSKRKAQNFALTRHLAVTAVSGVSAFETRRSSQASFPAGEPAGRVL